MLNQGVSNTPSYWGGLSESQLAKFQQNQVGNTCALNAIASGFALLGYPLNVSGNDLGNIARSRGIDYQIPLIGGTLPFQQANVINNMSSLTGQSGLLITANVMENHGVNDVKNLLNDNKKIVLYTVYFNSSNKPSISNSLGLIPRDNIVDGHTMVFVAYDESHKDANGNMRPYGFINSWGAPGLSWMSQNDASTHASDLVIMSIE